ncbi:DUF1611 domain-containing protein [Arthrobacter crystallopoietes]|uniref:DUF1611 domain-containing protein n=1 Tax=Crystallibacter crystallopoietes TaxID=37928 RepID=A0A1H1A8L1_9MICC|nr:DUF1611 domain-containing protein [Arthrobacter crystallopoietes]SDQ35841.1 hypothetical protein SAMN04489742_0802 [Arthrobacter crystallopoietes]
MTLVAHPSEALSPTFTSITSNAATGVAADPQRLQRAKKAYTTRFLADRLALDPAGYDLLDIAPAAGDVVLAKVVEIGNHTKLESPASRRQSMFPGDEILVAFGNRYAPDQFLAVVPDDLGECSLVAGGGLAARVLEQHADIDKATTIQPIGLLAKDGVVVNLQDLAPHAVNHATELPGRPPVIAVLGTSMNSGKSTTLGCLVNGLDAAGLRVSAGKATGTGSGNDPRLFTDAGARLVLDFTDFGFPTTYLLDYETVRGLLTSLIDTLTTAETDVIVVEIADGVYQGETSRLLHDPVFHAAVDHVVFAAADALGATAGIGILQDAGVSVPAVSGLLTASPLAAREAAGVITTRVINTYDLCNPATALELLPARK